jgi:hypothetical protein
MARKQNTGAVPPLLEAKLSRDRTEAAIYFPEPEYLMVVDAAEVDRMVAALADIRDKMKPHP